MVELTVEQQRALALARARQRSRTAPQSTANARVIQAHSDARYPVTTSSILPFTRYSDGDVAFDSNAGVFGAVRRAVELPGQAMRGEIAVADGRGGVPEETIGRALEFGAVAAPVNPAVRAGDRAIPGMLRAAERRAPVPSSQQLRQAASSQFDQMRASGAEYPTDALVRSIQGTVARMNEDGFNETVAPRTFQTLRQLASPEDGAITTIQGLHSARRVLGRIPPNPADNTDYTAARAAIAELDRFISEAVQPTPTQASLPGPATQAQENARSIAAQLLNQANGNHSAARRSEILEALDFAADLRGATAHSGQGVGQQIRNRIATALTSARGAGRAFDAQEQEALEQVARGSASQNAVRRVANLLGAGQGLAGQTAAGWGAMAGSSVGGPIGAGVGAIVPVLAGGALRAQVNRSTRRGLTDVAEMTRRRSPLFDERFEAAEVAPAPVGQRAAILRALLAMPSAHTQPVNGGI